MKESNVQQPIQILATPDTDSFDNTKALVDSAEDTTNKLDKLINTLIYVHCWDRDCYCYPGYYHLASSIYKTDNPELLKTKLAKPVADLIDKLPDLLKGKGYDNYEKKNLITNVLGLASELRRPDLLQDALERALKEEKFKGGKDSPYQPLLKRAIFYNQGDRRYEDMWLKFIADDKHTYLPGDRKDAFWGLLYMPKSAEERDEPAIDAIAKAGVIFGDIFDSQKDQKTQSKNFRAEYLWPIVEIFGIDYALLEQLKISSINLSFRPWMLQTLNEFLDKLPIIQKRACVAAHFASQTEDFRDRGSWSRKGIDAGKVYEEFSDVDFMVSEVAFYAVLNELRNLCDDKWDVARRLESFEREKICKK